MLTQTQNFFLLPLDVAGVLGMDLHLPPPASAGISTLPAARTASGTSTSGRRPADQQALLVIQRVAINASAKALPTSLLGCTQVLAQALALGIGSLRVWR